MKKKFRFAAAFVTVKKSGGTCVATLNLKSNTINRHEVVNLEVISSSMGFSLGRYNFEYLLCNYT